MNQHHGSHDKDPHYHSTLVSVALVGPPNAGKSTLFNRLSGPPTKLYSDKKKNNKKNKLSGRLVSQGQGQGGGRTQGKGLQIMKQQPPHVRGTSIVSDLPGTTRDRKSTLAQIAGIELELLDTAGIDARHDHEEWVPNALQQTKGAAQRADLVFLLIDGRLSNLTSDVWETAQWLRSIQTIDHSSKSSLLKTPQVVVLVNKMERMAFGDYPPIMEEAERLGFGEPIPISALHGDGMAEVAATIQMVQQEKDDRVDRRDTVTNANDNSDAGETWTPDVEGAATEEDPESASKTAPLKMAIVGRINVGKSTLVNRLLRLHGEKSAVAKSRSKVATTTTTPKHSNNGDDTAPRVLAGPTPGLTRDAISLDFEWKPGQTIRLVDTAGIRKPSQYGPATPTSSTSTSSASPSPSFSSSSSTPLDEIEIERRAVQEAWHAVKTAEVAVLVLDAGAKMLQRQELAICQAILNEGRALVVAANKMDLVVEPGYNKGQFAADVRTQLEERFPLLRKTPIVPLSAETGANAAALLPAVWDARERWQRRISTPELNRWVRDIQALRSPVPSSSSSSSSSANAGRRPPPVRIKYALQTKGRPPTFVLFCNVDSLPDPYVRFLTRHFQDTFGLYGMEVRLVVKKSRNPFEGKSSAPTGARSASSSPGTTAAKAKAKAKLVRSRSNRPATEPRRSTKKGGR